MQLLIWDFDGTLGYREKDFKSAWSSTARELLEQFHPHVQYSGNHLSRGFPWHDWETPHEGLCADAYWENISSIYHRAFEGLGLAEHAQTLSRKVREQFCDVSRWHLYPDTLETLQAFRGRGYTQVILSNHVPELAQIVDHLGLSSTIEWVFNSGVTGFEKPHPQSYQQVLRAYPDAEQVTMLGDNRHADVKAPMKQGIHAWLVRAVDTELPSVPGLQALLQVL